MLKSPFEASLKIQMGEQIYKERFRMRLGSQKTVGLKFNRLIPKFWSKNTTRFKEKLRVFKPRPPLGSCVGSCWLFCACILNVTHLQILSNYLITTSSLICWIIFSFKTQYQRDPIPTAMRKAAEFYRNNVLFTLVREAIISIDFFFYLRKFDL